MRLGLNLGYWGAGDDAANLALAQEADRLGFAVVWAAEAWGSDVVSVLSWVAAQTERVDIGSAVMQIPARTPAMTAMTAATLDTLSGGRFRLGLGVSGPQVSEGWHGVRFDKPLGRTREYVEIIRKAMRREKLEYAGEHYTLPLPDGPGKALKLIVHPVREHVPVYLAAVGPKNLELAGEIADGVLPLFVAPDRAGDVLDPVRAGRAKAGLGAGRLRRGPHRAPRRRRRPGAPAPTRSAATRRSTSAAWAPGRRTSTTRSPAGWATSRRRARVQDLYLDRQQREAAEAVPVEFIDRTSLLGPPERIADRLQAYAAAGVTTLTVSPYGDGPGGRSLRTLVAAAERAGVG